MNVYARNYMADYYGLNSGRTTQNLHQTRQKTVNGCAIYCVAVRRWTSEARQKVTSLCGVSPILHRYILVPFAGK